MADNIFNDDERQYLQMMQDNITRMANNSANCKSWMVTLVAGFCAIGCSIDKLNGWIILAIIPVVVFWYLDTFYLQLERKMRNRQLDFILIVKDGTDNTDGKYQNALFNLAPLKKETLTPEEKAKGFVQTNDRAFSESIKPFYGSMLIVITLIFIFLNWSDVSGIYINIKNLLCNLIS